MNIRSLLIAVLFVASVPTAGAAPASPRAAEKAYEEGVNSYRSGQFERALKAFEQAERAGMRHPNLDLNLGLTNYRLGRFLEARAYFERIRSDLRYTAVADYHLGLVAARLGQREPAAQHFEAVQYMTMNPRLRNMALVALLRMDNLGMDYDPFATDAAAPRPDFYGRLASGFDSNPELIADRLEIGGGGAGASYAEARGDLNLPLLTTRYGQTHLRADAQVREYGGERGYDQYSGEVELRQAWQRADWRFGVSAEGGNAWLDGEAYEGMFGGGFDARRELPNVVLTTRLDTVRVNGEGQFAYLDGWRHRVGIEAARPLGSLRSRLNYEYELNERLDFEDEEEFSSHSPRRHAIGFAMAVPFGSQASLEGRARYRDSRYPEPNRFFVGDELRAEERQDRLLTLGMRGRLRGGKSWNWLADLQYNRNDSSIEDYRYTRHLLLVGVEWLR